MWLRKITITYTAGKQPKESSDKILLQNKSLNDSTDELGFEAWGLGQRFFFKDLISFKSKDFKDLQ